MIVRYSTIFHSGRRLSANAWTLRAGLVDEHTGQLIRFTVKRRTRRGAQRAFDKAASL